METAVRESLPASGLAAAISSQHAVVVAAQAELISLIAGFDARECWRADGARSMANWLVAALHVTYATALDWVELARALPGLPALASSLSSGALNLESAAAAARLVGGDGTGAVTDAGVTAEAEALPADVLRKAVRRQEQVAAREPGVAPRPALTWWHSGDGWTQFRGWLAPEDGAVVIAAIERAVSGKPDPLTGAFDPPDVAAAEALVALASTRLREDADPDRACVVVHISVESLVSGEGMAELSSGGAVPARVVRRLSCDGRLEVVLEDQAGLVAIAPAQRDIPHPLSRYLKNRDKCCRFPGCGMRRHLHAHHREHWADGGPTVSTNLLLLCKRHHSLVHDGGWSVVGNPEPGPGAGNHLVFLRPDGTPFVPYPPPERPAPERPELPDAFPMDLMAALRSRE
ncbi:MAG TPA: DUF222 domain-containing protein [Actinomycetota bacterium]|nr:DUF222 domain-containing protein [Actinomycetota bacterium]